jgi:hypothetical protein
MKKRFFHFSLLTLISVLLYAGCTKETEESTLSKGLVAYYPFNGNAKDASGKQNHGIIRGAKLTTDRFGSTDSAFYFNGNSWIEVADSASLNLTGDKTISAWIYLDSDSNNLLMYPTILAKNNDSSYYPTYGLQLNNYSGYGSNQFKFNFFFGKNTYNYLCNSKQLFTNYYNQWVQIIGTYSLTESLSKIYINGMISDSVYIRNTTSNANKNPLFIGRNNTSNYYKTFFTGKIDDIRLYNRALTEKEIGTLYLKEALPN